MAYDLEEEEHCFRDVWLCKSIDVPLTSGTSIG